MAGRKKVRKTPKTKRLKIKPSSDLELAARYFHQTNPHIYEAFKRFVFEVIQSGGTRVGAKMLWERMRWYTRYETVGEAWKLNNNHTAYYARMFEREHPQHRGIFEKRRVRP